jgi:hypothetical protein
MRNCTALVAFGCGLPADTVPADSDSEAWLAYAHAHRAHFVETSAQHALRAWDAYLHAFPRGAFVPEARYNRALCLIRLDRLGAAREALRPFAAGAIGRGYRQQDAQALLDWIERAR